MTRGSPFRHPKLAPVTDRLPHWLFRTLDRGDPEDLKTMIQGYDLPNREGIPKELERQIVDGVRQVSGSYVMGVLSLFNRAPYDDRLREATDAIRECLDAFTDDTISLPLDPSYIEDNPPLRDHFRAEVEENTGKNLSDDELKAEFEHMRTILGCVKRAAEREIEGREQSGATKNHKKRVSAARKHFQSSTRLVVRGVRYGLETYGDDAYMQPARRDRIIWAVLQALGEDITQVSASTLARYWSEAKRPQRMVLI
ncbi:hypothetical protein [Arhodomonas sp. KWT]|uniref:hypothetical protein n=1 Tax=Arhodomonas sp. KWT TaxID=2679915 RepID=UPI0013D5DE4B|nr:hypothetical protein [Arhodomonas sp. KWT]